MTRNEQIASILLEAAELLKNDNYSDINYFNNSILIESILYTDNSDVYLLTETADELNDIQKIADEVKKDKENLDENKLKKISQKIKKSVDNLLKWYYKIEPDKKFKALKIVLHGLGKILNVILMLLLALGVYSTGKFIYNPKSIGGGPNMYFAFAIVFTIIPIALMKIRKSLKSYTNEKFNISDYEANTKLLKDQIMKIDEQIKKSESTDNKNLIKDLYKMKESYTDCLNQLENLKNDYEIKKSKKSEMLDKLSSLNGTMSKYRNK